MLGKLVDEVMRRRLWPIVAVALLVAVATPLLFLKSTPKPAPGAATAARGTAGELPERARRLLASREAAKRAARRRGGSASDPFQPPASGTKPASKDSTSAGEVAASTDDGGIEAGSTTQDKGPVEVVITNSDGTPTTPNAPIADDGAAAKAGTQSATAVDVRFGATYPGSLHRALPRTQTFLAGDRVIAIFVKHSPSRDAAVFAIAPSTVVSGDVECRRKDGLCRYVDIPAGKSVRLTTSTTDGTLVTRRLAVERIQRTDAVTSTAPANASCLLSKMLTLSADDLPPSSDACPS